MPDQVITSIETLTGGTADRETEQIHGGFSLKGAAPRALNYEFRYEAVHDGGE